ncbi:MAG: type II secretion system F family protein [Lachnospiraceae bacterium]|nr:type II secretion system F family protein [Lachnospiraceae bacterium]
MNNRIPPLDHSLFISQLSNVLKAGVDFLNALKIIEGQIDNRHLKNGVSDVIFGIEEGEDLANALSISGVFSPCFIACMEKADEKNNLVECLDDFKRIYENEDKRRSILDRIIVFPFVTGALAVAFLMVIMGFLFPHFMAMFEGLDIEMPAFTLWISRISLFFRDYFLVILLVILLIRILGLIFKNIPVGRLALSRYLLKKAPSNHIKRRIIYSKFSELLSELLKYDIERQDALKLISQEFEKDYYFGDILETAGKKCAEGMMLSKALGESGFFSDMYLELISLGEETGNLKESLKDNHVLFLESANSASVRRSHVLEPLIIFTVAIVIMIFILAFMLPMIDLYDAVSRI